MAPHRDSSFLQSFTKDSTKSAINSHKKPSKLSMNSVQRTTSDISYEPRNPESINSNNNTINNHLLPISEVEDAKCECCGMSEECTPRYVQKIRETYCGKMICGLCSEAVKEEMEKNGGKSEEALSAHVSACAKFNRLGRAYPVLCQAEAMREILRKNRAKSISPRDKGDISNNKITRSSSCMPAISKEMNAQEMAG